MNRVDHTALCEVSDMLYQREVTRLRGLREEEARLRAALARLDEQARDARRLPDSALRGVREIGADMVWHGWLARNRAMLRNELAHILARKDHAMPALHCAFGRAEAARALHAQAQAEARKQKERHRADALVDLGIMARLALGAGPGQVS